MPRKKLPVPTDDYFILDLFHASRPLRNSNEHIVTLNFNFTLRFSEKLRSKGDSYGTEALRAVRDFLNAGYGVSPALDTVLVVERSIEDTRLLHAHGWIRVSKSITAASLNAKLREQAKKGGRKIMPDKGIFSRDKNPKTGGPVDSGWPLYILKTFSKHPPVRGATPKRRLAASTHTTNKANRLRKRRFGTKMGNLVQWMWGDTLQNPTGDEYWELKKKN